MKFPGGTGLQRLSDALRSAKASPEIKQRFRDSAAEDLDMSLDEFKQFLARAVLASQKLVTDLGLPKQ